MLAYFTATNDSDGNPRRAWVMLSDGRPIACWPEGYSGHYAVPGSLRDQAYQATAWPIAVTAATYARLCRLERPAYWIADREQMLQLTAVARRAWGLA